MVGLGTEFSYLARFEIKILKTIGIFFNAVKKKSFALIIWYKVDYLSN